MPYLKIVFSACSLLALICGSAFAVPLYQTGYYQQSYLASPQPPTPAPKPTYRLRQSTNVTSTRNPLWGLVGTWRGETMIDDKVNQEAVLERCRNGMFFVVSLTCSKGGDCLETTHVGRWAARDDVYSTTLTGQIVERSGGKVFQSTDSRSSQAQHHFQIHSLGHNNMSYRSLETGQLLEMEKLPEPESVDFCRRLASLDS
jgi:hypothetical protein